MRNFEVVLFCLIIGCLVQLIEPQEEIPPEPKLSILENSDFDPENDDETSQFSSRVRREESENDYECGISAANPRFPIWPWMAALFIKKNFQPDEIVCGGTVINKRFVMTSAICLTAGKGITYEPDKISVVLGLANRSGADHSQRFDIREVHVHPMYNSANFHDDIALLELEKPIEYNQYITPICLPTINNNFYKPESRGLGLGWGISEEQSMSTLKQNTLKEVGVVIQHPEVCKNKLSGKYARYFTDRLICGVEESPYLCGGDGGGPVMQSEMQEDGLVWTQVGIISFGIGCGPVNPLGFYSRVDKYLPWIQSIAF